MQYSMSKLLLALLLVSGCGQESLVSTSTQNSRSSSTNPLSDDAQAVIQLYSSAVSSTEQGLSLTEANSQDIEKIRKQYKAKLSRKVAKDVGDSIDLPEIFGSATTHAATALEELGIKVTTEQQAAFAALPFQYGVLPEDSYENIMASALKGGGFDGEQRKKMLSQIIKNFPSDTVADMPAVMVNAAKKLGIKPQEVLSAFATSLDGQKTKPAKEAMKNIAKLVEKEGLKSSESSEIMNIVDSMTKSTTLSSTKDVTGTDSTFSKFWGNVQDYTASKVQESDTSAAAKGQTILSSIVQAVIDATGGSASNSSDTDGDGILDILDQCPGTDDAQRAIRYIDNDGDGLFSASIGAVCTNNAVFTVAGASLTLYQRINLDPNDSFADGDLDGVADGSDQCNGADDTLIAVRYKDSDSDLLVVASSGAVCPNDATFTITAASLTAYQLANLDPDDSFSDGDLDGIANSSDQCPGTDDALIALRYKDTDGDGFYASSPGAVCADNGTYTVAAASLTAGQISNTDVNDSQADADNDGVANGSDQCSGTDDALMAIRYKDTDGDGFYVASSGSVCVDDGTYTVAAASLTAGQISNADPNDNLADADNDGVADGSDQCNGTDDALMAIRYKDADGDGFYVASSGSVCVDDATYTVAAASLTAGEISNADPNDAQADNDNDGVADGSDQCSGTDDALMAIRYKDADGDGFYAASSGSVCIDDGTYTVAAASLTAGEISNADVNDAQADDDNDGVADGSDQCSGTDDALMAIRYKDADGDGFYAASSGSVCVDDATYTVAAGSLTAGELSNLDVNDAQADNDNDGVADGSDQCSGTDDALMAIRYKDADGDGFYAASSGSVCVDDATYTVAAASLTAGEISNADVNDAQADNDNDGVADGSDQCSGTDDALMAVRYKDADGDGFYAASSGSVCIDDGTYTVAAGSLTAGELSNLDVNDAQADSDNDGVGNGSDQCAGTDDGLMAVRYKDSDSDGFYAASSGSVCIDDGTYTVAAGSLTAGELSNLDVNDAQADSDNDGVGNGSDQCAGTDDGLMAVRYKDSDGDGFYVASSGAVCVDDGTYTVAAASLTAGQISNADVNDAQADNDNDGVADGSDQCSGADDALIAVRYKDVDGDSLFVASSGGVCVNDATYTYAAGDLTAQQISNPDPNDSFADGDLDGVTDASDICPGEDDANAGTKYKDEDSDGLTVVSPSPVCPSDTTYTILAGSLSPYQISHDDPDDDTAALTWNAVTITESSYGSDLNGDGDSIDTDTYNIIANTTQLLNAANNCSSGTTTTCAANFFIVNDLDFADMDGLANDTTSSDGAYTTSTAADIFNSGGDSNAFTGTINGNGRTISNLNIEIADTNVAFIGVSGDGAKIIDLTLNINVDSSGSDQTGGFIGNAQGSILMKNVHYNGDLSGGSVVGGLIATAEPASGSAIVTIEESSSRGTIQGASYVGGLVGGSENEIHFTDSYNLNTITSSGGYVSGILGIATNDATFTRVFNSGDVTASTHCAGIMIGQGSGKTRDFADVYNTADIHSTTKDKYAAGIYYDPTWGDSDFNFARVYSVGTFTNDGGDWNYATGDGAGSYWSGTASNVYYIDSNGASSGDGFGWVNVGTEKSGPQMKQQATYSGFNFSTVWSINEGTSTPYLQNVTPVSEINTLVGSGQD